MLPKVSSTCTCMSKLSMCKRATVPMSTRRSALNLTHARAFRVVPTDSLVETYVSTLQQNVIGARARASSLVSVNLVYALMDVRAEAWELGGVRVGEMRGVDFFFSSEEL